MFCILSIVCSSVFEGYIRLFVFAACFFTWQSQAHGSCPTDWVEYSGSCFKVIAQTQQYANIHEARQSCLSGGGDLVSISDGTEQSFVYELVNNLTSTIPSYVYMGLTDLQEEGNFTWLDGASVGFTNFAAPQPDNMAQYNGEHCTAIYSSDQSWTNNGLTSWIDVPCCFQEYGIKAVACEKPINSNISIARENDTIYEECFGGCPSGWYKYKGQCYGLVNSATAFNNTYYARETCFAHYADLPDVTTQNVSNHMKSILRKGNVTNEVVLANNDIVAEGTWTSRDGSEISYDAWGTNYPRTNDSENCAVLVSTDQMWNNDSNTTFWRDINCCDNQGHTWVMCEKPETINATATALDDNVFAEECYGHYNECLSNPCQNGATCEDHVMYYSCQCVPGYTAVNCETLIDHCDSNPCQNNGTCETLVNAYNCNCTSGYNGSECGNLYDHCAAFDPCYNNATCNNYGTTSDCTCMSGFAGVLCETNIDDCVNLTCINNGTCVDGINSAHCDCLPQFAGTTCEIELACTPVSPDIENATKYDNNTGAVPGGKIYYQCLPGHKFPDLNRTKVIECMPSGFWSPLYNDPYDYCEPHCDALPFVSNSIADTDSTKVGIVLNYTCDVGYQLYDNTTGFNVTCLQDGNWSIPIDEVPQCEIVTCEELPIYPHQTLNKLNTTYNTTVTFWCDVGHVLPDLTIARTIRCLFDGEWTATLPPCDPVECPQLPDYAGLTRNTTANTYKTIGRHTCDSGKRMVDGATYRVIQCDATGEWSDNITDCDVNRCFPLPYVGNATPSDTNATFGSMVTLTCITGHRFWENNNKHKELTMTCHSYGRWSPLLTACEPLFCPAIPSNINSKPDTNNTLFGTEVEISCNRGHYFPDGTDFIFTECIDDNGDDAIWNISSVEPCWPIVCSDPPDISNTTNQVSSPANLNYSSEFEYECIDEHRFIDGETRRTIYCNEIGQWSHTDLSCRRERCDPVPTAHRAVPDTTNTSWYTVVTYECDIGHHWDDIETYTINCMNTGFWNDTNVPTCIINECADVEMFSNTTANDTVNHVYNTFVKYSCEEGFRYADETTEQVRWCAPNKIWQPVNFPTCNIVYCPELIDVENATRDTNDTAYNTLVTYECETGYQYPDKSRIKTVYCSANETWTEFPPACEVVFCPPVPYWDAEFNSTDNNFLAVISYWCQDTQAFEDSNKDTTVVKSAQCLTTKVWDPPLVNCLPLDSIAKDLVGVSYESEEAVPIGTIACSLMCLMVAALVLLDLHKIITDLKMMKDNIQSMLNDRNAAKNDDPKNGAESTA